MFNNFCTIASKARYQPIVREGIKTLSPKQILQRSPIVFAEVKACNTSAELLNEIRQIYYSFYGAKKVYY